MNADRLINEYARLGDDEQRNFDRRYRGLIRQRRIFAKASKAIPHGESLLDTLRNQGRGIRAEGGAS